MKKLMLLSAGALMLGACVTPTTHVGTAWFTDVQQPTLVTNAPGTKTGRACATNILGIVSKGDMSIEAAKKNGNITQVATVDTDVKSWIVYAEVCTVVTGR